MNKTEQWIARISGNANRVQVAKKAGIPHPTLSRQAQADLLTVDNILKIARAYNASIPDALIAHGIVTADELSSVTVGTTLADATELSLLEELARRAEARGTDEVSEELQDEAIRTVREENVQNVGGSGQDATVHDLDEMRNGGLRNLQDDLKAVASERGADEGIDNYDA